jgi:hypothetical protein
MSATALFGYDSIRMDTPETESNSGRGCEVWSVKDMVVAGKKLKEIFFAGVRVNTGKVGFYFFPIYTYPDRFRDLPPELEKALTGKSCFHFRKLDEPLEKHVADLLERGFRLYSKEKLI